MNAYIALEQLLRYTSGISKLYLLSVMLSLFVYVSKIGELKSASSSVKVVYEFCHRLAALSFFLFLAAKWLNCQFFGTFANIIA